MKKLFSFLKQNYKNLLIYFLLIVLIISILLNINLINKKDKIDENIIFFGDSITNKYNVDEFFPNTNVINSGISGNKSDDLLTRLDNDVYKFNPSKIFILIGINDLNHNYSESDILSNIQKIINGIKTNRKNTEILIESVYPINKNILEEFNSDVTNDTIKDFNKKLKKLCLENKITYINVYDTLLDSDGNLKESYTYDGLHLNDLGYFKVTLKLQEYIEKEL